MITANTAERLKVLHGVHKAQKDRFFEQTSKRRAALFAGIKEGRNRLLDEVFDRVRSVRAESEKLTRLRAKVYRYFDFSDWSLIDMVALAVCAPGVETEIAKVVAPNALLYHSLRMLDDVLDGHKDYKGGERTLLGDLTSEPDMRPLSVAGNLLPVMIVAVTGARVLPEEDFLLYERTILGMLHETFAGDWSTGDGYRRIAEAKMGAYGMFLYRPVVLLFDPGIRKTLESFLMRSFYISQLLNDLNDQREDSECQQPNFWLAGRPLEETSGELLGEIDALARACDDISPVVRDYAHTRVTDLIGFCLQVMEANDQNRRHRTVKAS